MLKVLCGEKYSVIHLNCINTTYPINMFPSLLSKVQASKTESVTSTIFLQILDNSL